MSWTGICYVLSKSSLGIHHLGLRRGGGLGINFKVFVFNMLNKSNCTLQSTLIQNFEREFCALIRSDSVLSAFYDGLKLSKAISPPPPPTHTHTYLLPYTHARTRTHTRLSFVWGGQYTRGMTPALLNTEQKPNSQNSKLHLLRWHHPLWHKIQRKNTKIVEPYLWGKN